MGTIQQDGAMILSPLEKDAIGEVMNISMGTAATAVSQMLDKQVEITTPSVEVQKLGDLKYDHFEPALLVKIVYTTGLTGSNCMVFRQHDMQMILNTLMGIPDPPSDEFVFDELSTSAACEVMNQMMGSSATALAEFLGKTVDISTPTAVVMDSDNTFLDAMGMQPGEDVTAITFRLSIKDMLDSEFICVLTTDLVRDMLAPFIQNGDVQAPPRETPPPPSAAAAPPPPASAAPSPAAPVPVVPAATPAASPPMPAAQPAAYPPPQPAYAPAAPPAYAQPAAYPPQPAYPPLNVRPVEFPEFSQGGHSAGVPLMGNNMDLIMNVPLEVSIEIGTTKRKIRDIMNFTSGTVVELDKQAGAPVDIVVNGQMIAHGDVVVIDDNFGVRITEIVGTKELINSLSGHAER